MLVVPEMMPQKQSSLYPSYDRVSDNECPPPSWQLQFEYGSIGWAVQGVQVVQQYVVFLHSEAIWIVM